MKTEVLSEFLLDQGEILEESTLDKIKLLEEKASPQAYATKLKVYLERKFPDIDFSSLYQKLFPQQEPGVIKILKSYEKNATKRSVQDFAAYFNLRYRNAEKLLKGRAELSSLTSINRVKSRKDQTVSIIGMVVEKNETKNGHFIIQLEDQTGQTKILVHKDNAELIDIAKDIQLDDVIAVNGQAGEDIVFSNMIIYPDVPLSKELKKSPYDHYAVFTGDMQFGSKEFLHDEFNKYLQWLNGRLGTLKQREMARKVKYFFLVGDVIDGAGIYPGQENHLDVPLCKDQYALATEYLKKVPKHIKIIICAGNHDVGRIAEPQFPIPREYAPELYEMENVIMVSNPAKILCDVSEEFSGIEVLMYHGGSLPYYADQIPSIRAEGGLKKSDKIMMELLKRRHMAPAHGCTLYVPDRYEDPLFMDTVPDIFLTGHIHRAQTDNYRNVTVINSSAWLAQTEDQTKRGIESQPGRAFVVSLKTRQVKLMNFMPKSDK
jgi:DNA polymerase II small subunit